MTYPPTSPIPTEATASLLSLGERHQAKLVSVSPQQSTQMMDSADENSSIDEDSKPTTSKIAQSSSVTSVHDLVNDNLESRWSKSSSEETVKKNRVQADQARTSQRILLDRERSKSSAMLSRIGSIFHSKRQKASKPDISIPVPTLNSQRHSTRLSRPPGDGSEPRSATLPTPRPSIDTAALTPLMSAIPTEYIRPVARPRSDPDLGGAANGISITQLVHSIRSRATKETDPERKYWLLSFAVALSDTLMNIKLSSIYAETAEQAVTRAEGAVRVAQESLQTAKEATGKAVNAYDSTKMQAELMREVALRVLLDLK